MAGKKRKVRRQSQEAAELNIMPFIDIFSMLNTFLLVSASFIGLGIHEVQVPFLSNSPEVKEAPSRSFEIRVDLEKEKILLTTQWTSQPIDKKELTYTYEAVELEKFHDEMIRLRNTYPESDKVTLYSDDDVPYENIVLALDEIKVLKKEDPPLTIPEEQLAEGTSRSGKQSLYHKVVMGSVIL